MVVYSGSNTDCKSSEPLKTVVMLCYVSAWFQGSPDSGVAGVGVTRGDPPPPPPPLDATELRSYASM